ncbi:MAG: hypothetical protein HN849_34360 [Victivallales bacterium]|nr:hypothetical protein [Victivallales bacterium]
MALLTIREAIAANEKLCGAEDVDDVVIDFRTKGATIKALGAVVTEGECLTVTFPKAGAGVLLSAPDGKWNWYRYVAVAVDVKNTGAEPVSLIGHLNERPWNNSFVHVPAGEAGPMIMYLMRKRSFLLDRRKEQFVGMNGIPGGHVSHWDVLDPRAVKTISVRDLDGVSVGQAVQILRVRGIGAYGAIPKAKEKAYFPFVDKFGQFKHADWIGKVKSTEDLQGRIAKEATDLDQNPAPGNRSAYGGWAQGPKLKATGHFRTEKHKGKWWLVDPDGYLFWSHGITGVHFRASTKVGERKYYFEAIPKTFGNQWKIDFAQANLAAKYGPDWEKATKDLSHRRLQSWGMNTIANWSEPKIYGMKRTPYTVAIHYAGYGKEALAGLLKTPDLFREALRKRLAKERDTTANDPWCIGYFVDNEIRWRKGMDANLYYKIVREEVKRAAPNKLYLGSRLHGHAFPHGSKPHIVAAAAKYCDVLSINRYRFTVSDLTMLKGVDLPIVIGEFHFGALDRGMIHTGLRGVASQEQRAYAYEHYLKQALTHPNIVGTHWFQFREQNVTGRGDGENYQIGFVDICDTPYQEIIDSARKIGQQMYELRAGKGRE